MSATLEALSLRVGGQLRLREPSLASCGCVQECRVRGDAVEAECGFESPESESADDLIVGGGQDLLLVRALRPGRATVEWIARRPWIAGEEGEGRRLTLTVDVAFGDDELARATTPAFAARLRQVAYHVRASRFEQHLLSAETSRESPREHLTTHDWSGQGSGSFHVEVGRLAGRPVVLDLRIETIDGADVLFYDCRSQVADWDMIQHWVDTTLPPPADLDGRPCCTNAANFHLCLHELDAQSRRRMEGRIVNGDGRRP